MIWQKRRKKSESDCACFARRYDATKCFCVCEIRSKYGLTSRVLAIAITDRGETIISRHRTAKAARRACERFARKNFRQGKHYVDVE
jgi:hypothetical protein